MGLTLEVDSTLEYPKRDFEVVFFMRSRIGNSDSKSIKVEERAR